MKLSLPIVILVGAMMSPAAPTARAEGITQEQADAILNELKGIRQLLQQQRQNTPRRAAPAQNQKVKLPLVETFTLGSKDAPVTLVEFTDYQCPYCSRFHKMTFPEIQKQFIDTGKVRFVSRDLPLGFHQNAMPAARATRCAGEQEKYWELRHKLSSNPKNLSDEAIMKYVGDLELDRTQFEVCFRSNKYESDINKDIAAAKSVGITGTPGFIVGSTPTNGTLEGIRMKGAQQFAAFAAKINTLLAKGKQQSPTLPKTK